MIDFSKIEKDENVDYHPFFYKGFRCEQSQNIFEALDKLSEVCKPSQIIEIGSRDGGFTKILEDHPLSEDAKIYSYDIQHKSDKNKFHKVDFISGDCFNLEKEIAEIISKDGVTLVFCDGGDKNREINIFSKYLKDGDFIFGHDYAPTREFWEKNYKGKIWDWHETWDSAIENSVVEFNLKDALPEYFNKAVWKSLRK